MRKPTLSKITKIVKSDPFDSKISNLVTLSHPFRGHKIVRFEHVVAKDKTRKQRYAHGGTCIVKKVFSQQGELLGVVKIVEKEEYLQKELKYQEIFGREVVYGTRNDKWYQFMPGYEAPLSVYTRQLGQFIWYGQPMTLPYFTLQQRLAMFVGYLQQVKILHDRGEVLGDPKTHNVMVDWELKGEEVGRPTLNIIDFDAVHRQDSDEKFLVTRRFLPPNLISKSYPQICREYSQQDDIFIFGHMLAELFPEFFSVEVDRSEKIARFSPQIVLRIEYEDFPELRTLVDKMTAKDPKYRADINECLQRLEEILSKKADKIQQLSAVKQRPQKELKDWDMLHFERALTHPLLEATRELVVKAVADKMDQRAEQNVDSMDLDNVFELVEDKLLKSDEIKDILISAVDRGKAGVIKGICRADFEGHHREIIIAAALHAAQSNKIQALSCFSDYALQAIAEKSNPAVQKCVATVVLNKLNPKYPLKPNLWQRFWAWVGCPITPTAKNIVDNMGQEQRARYGNILQAAGYQLPRHSIPGTAVPKSSKPVATVVPNATPKDKGSGVRPQSSSPARDFKLVAYSDNPYRLMPAESPAPPKTVESTRLFFLA